MYDIISRKGNKKHTNKCVKGDILMKKIIKAAILIFILLITFSVISYATVEDAYDKLNVENTGASQLVGIKAKNENELQDYVDKYGSDSYGLAAYILNMVRIYSIPFCFIGIAVGGLYQYVLGIRKMDVRDKGLGLIITFITILVICQILPLIFAIVVRGWRG